MSFAFLAPWDLLLTCRQRTIRELQVGQTLFKDGQGRWVIRHGPADYKTGKSYGERPPMVLAPHIYPELQAFLETWRDELKPKHDFLFSRPNGEPLTGNALYKLFYTSCYRYAEYGSCTATALLQSPVSYPF